MGPFSFSDTVAILSVRTVVVLGSGFSLQGHRLWARFEGNDGGDVCGDGGSGE